MGASVEEQILGSDLRLPWLHGGWHALEEPEKSMAKALVEEAREMPQTGSER